MTSTPEHWVRSQRAAAVDVGERLVLVGTDGAMRAIEGDGGAVAREVLGFAGVARTTDEIVGHVVALSGGEPGHTRTIVEQLLEVLRSAGAIVRTGATPAANPAARARGGGNVVIGVSGALAASHAVALVMAMQRRGWTVEVALSETAQQFVAVAGLEAVLQRAAHRSLWPVAPHAPVPHVALAGWADLVIVYPASATTIARLAHGEFSDIVAAVALTTRAPVVIVPSMNAEMLAAPAVQRNLDTLRADGVAIVHGVPGEEAADAPALRTAVAGVAPAAADVAATIDALVAASVLAARPASGPRAWDEMYRRALVPWASDRCDDDLAGALVHHAPPPARLLDVGTGLGQIARHAAGLGYRVVATNVSDVALARARREPGGDARGDDEIVWVRDDVCASALAGPFDVIVDRATLHTLPPGRIGAWAAGMLRLAATQATVIVKAHAEGVAGVTTGWSAPAIAALLPGFDVVEDSEAELPGLIDATPIPSRLVVLRR